MLIGIATDGDRVAQHFGRCPSYTLVEVEEGKEKERRVIPNPGHQPGFLPRFLAEKGVKVVIAGGMGPRARNIFAEYGIDALVGVRGSVDEAVEAFLRGELEAGDNICDHRR